VPKINVVFYRDENGVAPVLEWLDQVPPKAADKMVARILALREMGHELRRPLCDFLRDGIYELRVRHLRVNYRLLYFFHKNVAAVLAHGLTKEDRVPDVDIARAIDRRYKFIADPLSHTYEE
jgi:phage-related protein